MNRRALLNAMPGLAVLLGVGAIAAPAIAQSQAVTLTIGNGLVDQEAMDRLAQQIRDDLDGRPYAVACDEDPLHVELRRHLAWAIVMRSHAEASLGDVPQLRGEVQGLAIAVRSTGTYAPDHSFDHDWAVATLLADGLPSDGAGGWSVSDATHAEFERDRHAYMADMIETDARARARFEANAHAARVALNRAGDDIAAQIAELQS